jgi:ribosome assembly protein YihI (activator of Der GTPase)
MFEHLVLEYTTIGLSDEEMSLRLPDKPEVKVDDASPKVTCASGDHAVEFGETGDKVKVKTVGHPEAEAAKGTRQRKRKGTQGARGGRSCAKEKEAKKAAAEAGKA